MKFSLEISEDNICYSEYFERFNDFSINPSLSEDLWIEKEYKKIKMKIYLFVLKTKDHKKSQN